MLDFCPFEFKHIDLDNLAYELVFPNGWTWNDVKEKTVVGTDSHGYIAENDTRRDKHFTSDNTTEHIILLERKGRTGKNGFTLFKEWIEHKNAERHSENTAVTGSGSLTSVGAEEFQNHDVKHTNSDGYFEETWEDREGELDYIVTEEGIDAWVDADGDIVMQAMPCCPYCHNRLPIGWKNAEDFGAVSLMAPTSGGKTTFLYSMMLKNWSVLKNIGSINGKGINITSAHLPNDNTDDTYYHMVQEAKQLCKDNGKCPVNTQKGYWIPPVFLRVEYNGHKMIIGIYDNAGENLEYPDTIHNPNLKMLLDKMFADIYLFDPHAMNIGITSSITSKKKSENCRLLDVKSQGEFQKEKAGEYISAQSVLYADDKKLDSDSEKVTAEILDVYNSTQSLRTEFDCLEHMREMYFLGVIIKADLLENVSAIKNTGKYDALFDRNYTGGMLSIDQMDNRSALVEEMINEFHLLGSKDLDDFRIDYGEDSVKAKQSKVSWHCVSALGCDADLAGLVHGKYAPIRLAEPMVTCILKRIIDNGWLE